ncbi:MAG: hypothetical protein AB7I36_15290 [Rhodospirillaceae bacterium]
MLQPTVRQQQLLTALTLALMGLLFAPSVLRSFSDGTSWSVSDLHISYAAGFIRRGLLGEAAFQLQEASGLSTGVFFPVLFVLLTGVQIALLAVLAWPLRTRPALFLVVMLAPGLLLFPAYDYGGYLRKEVFVVIGLFGHALAVRQKLRGRINERNYHRFAGFVLAPYLALSILIHENQAIFLPAHALLIYMACGEASFVRHAARVQIPVLLPAVLCFAAATIHKGDSAAAAVICSAWTGRAVTACDAINALGWRYDQVWFYLVQLVSDGRALAIYVATIILALVPPILVRRALPPEGQAPLWLLLGACLPMAALFLLGWDWGRWIHMASAGVIALILAGAMRDLEPLQVRPVAALAALAGALLYVSTWRVNVCCQPTTLSGGLTHTLSAEIRAAFAPRADTRVRAVSVK